MYTSPYLVSRGAQEIRRNLQAEVARDRLAARAASPRQRSLSGVLTAVTATFRVLRQGLTTQPVRHLQRA